MVRHRFSSLSGSRDSRWTLSDRGRHGHGLRAGLQARRQIRSAAPRAILEEGSECNVCSAMPPKLTPEESKPVACRRRIAVDPSKTCKSYNNAANNRPGKVSRCSRGAKPERSGNIASTIGSSPGQSPTDILPPGLQNSEVLHVHRAPGRSAPTTSTIGRARMSSPR